MFFSLSLLEMQLSQVQNPSHLLGIPLSMMFLESSTTCLSQTEFVDNPVAYLFHIHPVNTTINLFGLICKCCKSMHSDTIETVCSGFLRSIKQCKWKMLLSHCTAKKINSDKSGSIGCISEITLKTYLTGLFWVP